MDYVIIIIDHNKLEREVYTFWLQDSQHLWLESYGLEIRKTPRHKFDRIKYYNRLDHRESNFTGEQVILSADIIALAKNKLIEQMQVQKWMERK